MWDDDSTVYGNSPEEQGTARSIKDYFTTVESEGAQQSLKDEDYGALPPEIIKIARIGVESIGWEKSASSSKKEEVKTPPVTNTNTGPSVIVPEVPSNAFSIASAKVKGKSIVVSLVLPDAGKVSVKATGDGVTVGSASASASASSGKGTVTLAISKAALSKLAKAKGHKFSVKITVTFTPTGGTAASKVKTLTLTLAAVTPKKKATVKGKKK